MIGFKPGQRVNIPCDTQPGAFPDEFLVTIETDKGVVSGFVKNDHLIKRNDRWYVQGEVVEASSDSVKVRIPGSFFTTAAGLTTASSGWATDNLIEEAHAS
jgi:hypothetical protein